MAKNRLGISPKSEAADIFKQGGGGCGGCGGDGLQGHCLPYCYEQIAIQINKNILQIF